MIKISDYIHYERIARGIFFSGNLSDSEMNLLSNTNIAMEVYALVEKLRRVMILKLIERFGDEDDDLLLQILISFLAKNTVADVLKLKYNSDSYAKYVEYIEYLMKNGIELFSRDVRSIYFEDSIKKEFQIYTLSGKEYVFEFKDWLNYDYKNSVNIGRHQITYCSYSRNELKNNSNRNLLIENGYSREQQKKFDKFIEKQIR